MSKNYYFLVSTNFAGFQPYTDGAFEDDVENKLPSPSNTFLLENISQ